jgi:hypothetical protein
MGIDVEVLERGSGGREPDKSDCERRNQTEKLQRHRLPPAPGSGRKMSLLKGCPEFKIKGGGYESNGEMQPPYKKIICGQGLLERSS